VVVVVERSMPRYWVIAPVEAKPSEQFDKVWKFDLANNLISIGWSKLGDVSSMSREQLSEAIASTYPEKPAPARGLYANMIWAFYHEISLGDFVIARRGRKVLAAVGKVNQTAMYDPGRNPNCIHPNFLSVEWNAQPRDREFPTVVFPMQTLKDLSETESARFTTDSSPAAPADVPEDIEDTNAFVLEKYLEDFIVTNFQAILKGELKIYEDKDGNEGQQYEAPDIGGRIDILAIEPKTKSFVVIELKKGRPSDPVVGQVLRYMGWVKKNLCTDGQGVKGFVICREPDPKLTYALAATQNIEVRYYRVSFDLTV
jgi:restriction system protein